jgi:fructose-1,6-bisphosphatase/inositol monophosphatase family enzyme
MVATSIGLAVGGVPVVGVIYNPFLDQMVSQVQYDLLILTDHVISTRPPRVGERT